MLIIAETSTFYLACFIFLQNWANVRYRRARVSQDTSKTSPIGGLTLVNDNLMAFNDVYRGLPPARGEGSPIWEVRTHVPLIRVWFFTILVSIRGIFSPIWVSFRVPFHQFGYFFRQISFARRIKWRFASQFDIRCDYRSNFGS